MPLNFVDVLSWGGPGWLAGLVCAGVAAWHDRRLEGFRCPGAKELERRAREAAAHNVGEAALQAAKAELVDLRDEAARALTVAALVPRGMARIALAAGTAVAVLALAQRAGSDAPRATLSAVVAFSGGVFGSALAAAFGRRARERVRAWRAEWKLALHEAEVAVSNVRDLGDTGSSS